MQLKQDVLTDAVAEATRFLPSIYALIALIVGLLLCLLTPPFWTPDEVNHARREIAIGQGAWMAERTSEGAGGEIDTNFNEIVSRLGEIEGNALRLDEIDRAAGVRRETRTRITEAQIAPLRQLRWAHRTEFTKFLNTAVYPPWLYLPQVVGWRLAEAAGLTILNSLVVTRMLTVLCAISLGWLAMYLCGAGRWLLFAYLLTPTALNLNASCSQDAMLLPAAALVAVLLGRAIGARRLLTKGELAVTTVLLTACVGARPPYLPLAAVLLLPGLEQCGRRWRLFVGPALAMLAITICTGLWQFSDRGIPVTIGPDAQPSLQRAFLVGHPLEGAEIMVRSVLLLVPKVALTGMARLGANDVVPPLAMYALLLLSFFGVVAFAPWQGLKSWYSRWTLLLSIGAVAVGISLAEYIIWTPVHSGSVKGVQFRYYLPLFPLLFLLLSAPLQLRMELAGWPSRRVREICLLAAVTVFSMVVLATPWTVAERFYHLSVGAALRGALS